MKNTLLIVLLAIAVFECKTTYKTTVSGLENNASVKVIKANKSLNTYDSGMVLIIDDNEYEIGKIYSEKKSMKASVFPTTPGKHKVIIKRSNQNVYEKNLFIDNRETRIIILE